MTDRDQKTAALLHDMENTAQRVLELAKKAGAGAAQATLTRNSFVETGFKDGELDKAEASEKQGLGIRLFLDGRYATHTTSDLRPEALAAFIKEAAALTARLEPDPDRALPDPERQARPPAPDLRVYDPEITRAHTDQWLERGRLMEEAARWAAGEAREDLVSTQCGAYAETAHEVVANTNGFLGSFSETASFTGAMLVLSDPGPGRKKRSGHCWEGERSLAALGGEERREKIAREALARARQLMGAKACPGGAWPVVVENRAAVRLVSDLVRCLTGPMLKQERSFLAGRLGSPVAGPALFIEDAPLLPGGMASRWFDGEGVASRPLPVIEAGVLKTYYLDTYHARALKMPPTAGSTSNLVLRPSHAEGFEQLMQSIPKGLAVTGFLGGNFNSTTGDFSYGVSGLWIENGKAAHPVEGVNLSGNFLGLWNGLAAVGSDAYPYSGTRAPSLVFAEAQVGGS